MALNAVKAVQAADDIRAYSLYIDGKWAPASDGATADDFNPATGALFARVARRRTKSVTHTIHKPSLAR